MDGQFLLTPLLNSSRTDANEPFWVMKIDSSQMNLFKLLFIQNDRKASNKIKDEWVKNHWVYKLFHYLIKYEGILMSCVQSFNNICQRIVSPTRYPINEKDLSKRHLIKSSESFGHKKLPMKHFKFPTIIIKDFPSSSFLEISLIFRQYFICMETVDISYRLCN